MKKKKFKTWKEHFKYCKIISQRIHFLDGRFKYPMIKCATNYSLILLGKYFFMNDSFLFKSENGSLFFSGQIHENNYKNTFHKIPFHQKIIQISAGHSHILALSGMFSSFINFHL